MPLLACCALLLMGSPSPIAPQVPSHQDSGSQLTEGARKDAASGCIPYKTLTWDDFPTTDDAASFSANTQGFIHYDFKSRFKRTEDGFDAVISQMEIRSGFDAAKSWRKSEFSLSPDKLLAHEQGHLDINETFARKLRKVRLSEWPVGSGGSTQTAENSLEYKLSARLKETIDACIAEQRQYDEETQHGKIESAQKAWATKIKRDLDAAK